MGKAAIKNPYLDTLGGGERYTLSFAKVLADKGYQVDVEWKNPGIKEKLENRFGINLEEINFVPDIKKGDGYDLTFWVSDGSIPLLHSRNNILHFQVPFHGVGGASLLNKMKLFRINNIVCNSEFTKKVIDAEFKVKSTVIFPPVPTDKIKPKRKENMILFVGRFSELKQSKHQDILIKNFKKLCDTGLIDWKLVICGGVEVGVGELLLTLEKEIEGYPIQIIKSPDFDTLRDLYGKAKLFWTASGYGENEKKDPEKVEHFGITLVEAMAGGAVPVVYYAGGHREIVKDGKTGFVWKKESELIKITKRLISNKKLWRPISLAAIESSKRFAYEKFESEVNKLL